jgi:hypothetical protein
MFSSQPPRPGSSGTDLAQELLALATAIRQPPSPDLVPVRIVSEPVSPLASPTGPNGPAFRLAFGPFQVAIPPSFDERDLTRLLAVLRASC